MCRRSLRQRRSVRISGLLAIATCFFLSQARADIITDIEQLDKPKDKKEEKEKEKEKEKDKKAEKGKAKSTPEKPTTEDLPPPMPAPQAGPVIFPPPASGDNSKPKISKEQRSNAPIHLQSDGTSTYSRDNLVVQMEKNVIITQEDLRLQSNEATVHLAENKSESNGVKSAELVGKVSISRNSKDPAERMNARSDRANFDNNAQTVVLEGNARLWREGNLIKGEKITYEITTGMIKVDRAQGVVQPDKVKQP